MNDGNQMNEYIENRSYSELIHDAVSLIIRPQRTIYDQRELEIDTYSVMYNVLTPAPVNFANRRGEQLVGSIYFPKEIPNGNNRIRDLPQRCVIFLHGNIGNQMEGRAYARYFAVRELTYFCFDFSGCGLSGGEFITLGKNESDDVLDSIEFLSESFGINEFVLWGRSMGAATAVLTAHRSPLIKGIIVDSSFSSLNLLFHDMANELHIHKLTTIFAVWLIKREVYRCYGLDCDLVSPIEAAAKSRCPMLLAHSVDDELVPYSHGRALFEAYAGKKTFEEFSGPHNSTRGSTWILRVIAFVLQCFGETNNYTELVMINESPIHFSDISTALSSVREQNQS